MSERETLENIARQQGEWKAIAQAADTIEKLRSELIRQAKSLDIELGERVCRCPKCLKKYVGDISRTGSFCPHCGLRQAAVALRSRDAAIQDFIQKVDSGRAKSVDSYRKFKEALLVPPWP